MQPITVLFFGPQGAGKGTQVKMLIDFLKSKSDRGIIHIDIGAELRTLRDTGTHTGKLTGEIIDAGNRVPDFIAIYLIEKALAENFTGAEHIIADGATRRPNQTTAFDDAMQFYGCTNFHIINLRLSEEESIKRLLARGRNDDTEEAIRRRLDWHKAEVEPLLHIFEERSRTIHHVDGNASIEDVHARILAALGLA